MKHHVMFFFGKKQTKLVGQGSILYNQPKPSTIIWEMPQNVPIKFGIMLDPPKNGPHLNHPSKLPMDYESVNLGKNEDFIPNKI